MVLTCIRFIYLILFPIISCIRTVWNWINSSLLSGRKQIIQFDNGITVQIQQKIAEGGFSYVYSAIDTAAPSKSYAIKRILCADDEMVYACREEAGVHRILGHHPNILPLLGFKFESQEGNSTTTTTNTSMKKTVCYMLFPLLTGGTLRDEIKRRHLLDVGPSSALDDDEYNPISERDVLVLFRGIVKGVEAMHEEGLAHRDIKVENVLLDVDNQFSNNKNDFSYRNDDDDDEEWRSNGWRYALGKPVLMDFGSARPLVVKLSDRRTVLNLTEEASQHSTISYRAPELFEGGCRHGANEPDVDGKVDVWSCGCLLYAMMFGTSPFEMEFRRDGSTKVVECTQLRVLGGKISLPPKHTAVGKSYSQSILELVQWILIVDRIQRPTLKEVLARVENILVSNFRGKDKKENFDGIFMS